LILGIILVVVIVVCICFVLSHGKLPESADSTTENRIKNIQGRMIYQTKTGGDERFMNPDSLNNEEIRCQR
jgi:hypothetical protein